MYDQMMGGACPPGMGMPMQPPMPMGMPGGMPSAPVMQQQPPGQGMEAGALIQLLLQLLMQQGTASQMPMGMAPPMGGGGGMPNEALMLP